MWSALFQPVHAFDMTLCSFMQVCVSSYVLHFCVRKYDGMEMVVSYRGVYRIFLLKELTWRPIWPTWRPKSWRPFLVIALLNITH